MTRVIDDDLWQAVKTRQGEIADKYVNVTEAIPGFVAYRATALGALKTNDNRIKARLADRNGTSDNDLKQCADRHLGTKFRKRGDPLYLAVLIGRTRSTLNYAILRLFAHKNAP